MADSGEPPKGAAWPSQLFLLLFGTNARCPLAVHERPAAQSPHGVEHGVSQGVTGCLRKRERKVRVNRKADPRVPRALEAAQIPGGHDPSQGWAGALPLQRCGSLASLSDAEQEPRNLHRQGFLPGCASEGSQSQEAQWVLDLGSLIWDAGVLSIRLTVCPQFTFKSYFDVHWLLPPPIIQP